MPEPSLLFMKQATTYLDLSTTCFISSRCPEGLAMISQTAREQNREQLDAFVAALNRFLKTLSSNMSMLELRASAILKVHYLFVAIKLGVSGANDETKFDDFTAEFGQMLKLVESSLGPSTPND